MTTASVAPRAAALAAALGSWSLVLLLAGCASPVARPEAPTTAVAVHDTVTRVDSWSGRLSLQVHSDPAQSFAALFDLRGTPERGSLVLTSPIGSTLAELSWAPGEARLRNGAETRRYDSVDALVTAATGAAIPVRALFGWLEGRDERVAGWRPDLQQVAQGRLRAVRESPQPGADLRIVFERP
jgi:outer membrane lipoprotein LolB